MTTKEMTREQAEKIIGKKTSLPAGKSGGGLNDLTQTRSPGNTPRSGNTRRDPMTVETKRPNLDPEVQKEMGYKKGGMVRGCGAAVKGKTKGKMY